jgi:hypothetical protein
MHFARFDLKRLSVQQEIRIADGEGGCRGRGGRLSGYHKAKDGVENERFSGINKFHRPLVFTATFVWRKSGMGAWESVSHGW